VIAEVMRIAELIPTDEEEFLTPKEKHFVKKALLVILGPFFLVYLVLKIFTLGIKKIFWNKITKWFLKKILFFPLKFLQFLGKEIDAFTTLLD